MVPKFTDITIYKNVRTNLYGEEEWLKYQELGTVMNKHLQRKVSC